MEEKNKEKNFQNRNKDILKIMLDSKFSRGMFERSKDKWEKDADEILDFANKEVQTYGKKATLNDAYGNKFTAVGTDDKIKSFTQYGFSNDTLNWTLWSALYNDSWIFRRIIDKPATDMVRAGFTILSDIDQSIKDKIYKDFSKIRTQYIQLLKWGALYGGSIGVLMFDNFQQKDYLKPINEELLKKSKTIYLYATDRWYGVSLSTSHVKDMNSLDYGKPTYYTVTLPNGSSYKIHHSFILRYEHRDAPPFIKNGYLQGWGYAEGAHVLNELARDDQLKADITSLINKSLIEVIKMDGMKAIFMGEDEESKEQLQARLEMVEWARNFNSLTFLDTEDEYQEHGFSGLTGLADLLEQNMWLVAAAVEMPGILFGDLKNGFSNDTEALERYDETILNRNEDLNRKTMEKLLRILFKKYDVKEPLEFEFNSLISKKKDEEKMNAFKSFQEVLSSLLQDGVIDTKRYAQAIVNYTTKGNIDFNLDEKYIESLEDKFNEEMEDINLDLDSEKEEDISNTSLTNTSNKKSLFDRMFKRKK